MEILAQKATADLPVLLVDSRDSTVTVAHPGLQAWGYLAVEGTLEYDLVLESSDSDPSDLKATFRLLSAHYSPPPGASQEVVNVVNQVNLHLAGRLLGENPPTASA